MINTQAVEAALRTHYPKLEQVREGVFRGIDSFQDKQYAVRYFDLRDDVEAIVNSLRQYQEDLVSPLYFSTQTATDLRWNHYLYFIASNDAEQRDSFKAAKREVESNREYARKKVVLEKELSSLFPQREESATTKLPADLASEWQRQLDEHQLSYVLSEKSVPRAVQRLSAGETEVSKRPPAPRILTAGEQAASLNFLSSVRITRFREYPTVREHNFGKVNLIFGVNGTGKTSLLDAIEYLYCGQNRRTESAPAGTKLEGDFVGSPYKLTTTAATEKSQLRARHSRWYSKNELKTLTLADSFGKFNYLDTDAAVRLSIDSSEAQIGEDVARLVLGSDAEVVADRIRRVNEQVIDALKDRDREISTKRTLLLSAQARLKSDAAVRKLSDEKFVSLQAVMDQAGWAGKISHIRDLDSLIAPTQTALTALEALKPYSHVLLEPKAALVQRIAEVQRTLNQAIALQQSQLDARQQLAERTLTHAGLEKALKQRTRMLEYVKAEFSKVASEIASIQDELKKRRPVVNRAVAALPPSVPNGVIALPVSAVLTAQELALNDARRAADAAKIRLQDAQKRESEAAKLRVEVRSLALQLLKHQPHESACPVCATGFEPGELLEKLALQDVMVESASLGPLQNDLQTATSRVREVHELITWLRALTPFASEPSITVRQAQLALENDEAKLRLMEDKAEILTGIMQQLESSDFNLDELSSLLRSAREQVLPTEEVLETTISDIRAALAAEAKRIQEMEDQLRAAEGQERQLRLAEDVPNTAGPGALVDTLAKRLNDLQVAAEARQTLDSLIQIGPFEQLTAHLSRLQQLRAEVSSELSKEAAMANRASQDADAVRTLSAAITSIEGELQRLRTAHILLNKLLKEGVGGALAQEIMVENAAQIAATFSAIHMPNEFDLKTDAGKLQIVRRASKEAVQLFEMSTGQRAAFALSLFLAMNSRVISGPPLLLFDDPVAHVDDINVLSFLDLLRGIALEGKRQVFFATADSKLAGLFRHKFRFLGPLGFREINLSRQL